MRKKKKEEGQALVEFALILPVLLLLVFGIIAFGWLFFSQIVITSAAREGARVAVVTGEVSDSNDGDALKIKTAIQNAASSLNINSVEWQEKDYLLANEPDDEETLWYAVNYTDPNGAVIGAPVEIYVKGKVKIIAPIISSFIGDSKTVSSKAVMRIESL